jgi:hypothetical protein
LPCEKTHSHDLGFWPGHKLDTLMARKTGNFTDKEREILRQRLLAHKDRYDLSPQKISDQIAQKTGFEAALDGGRKRVDRFLKAIHKPPEDFIAAVAAYLNDVAPPDIEESAMAIARLLAKPYDGNADLSELIGRYQTYLRPVRNMPPPYIPEGIGTVAPQYTQAPQHSFDMAYSIIDMTPLDQSNSLMVFEYASNIKFDPEIDSFPDNPLALKDTGVLVPSGPNGFLIVTRSLLQTRHYQVHKIADDPLILRGDLTIEGASPIRLQDGGAGSSKPEWEAELVKVAGIGDG